MLTPKLTVVLALLLAAAAPVFVPVFISEAFAQSSDRPGEKSSGRYEEHYETVPADIDPGSATSPAANDDALPEPIEPPSRATAYGAGSAKKTIQSDRSEKSWNEDDASNERNGGDDNRLRQSTRRRTADNAPDDGDDIADVSYFFDALDNGGRWISHPRYGEVFRPQVDGDWRPYTLGRWAYSDDFGWTWVSDEPFGWAVYHYGRWAFNRDDGWIWIPGTEWAPAWVAWRRGEEAIGWAPLPPNARFEKGRMAFDQSELESERYEQMWVFVRPRYFARPEMRRYLRPASWNAELRYRTQPNGGPNYGYERTGGEKRGYYANRGLGVEDVERLANRPVARIRIAPVDEPSLRRRESIEQSRGRDGRELKIYRPERRRTEEAVRKQTRDRTAAPASNSADPAPKAADAPAAKKPATAAAAPLSESSPGAVGVTSNPGPTPNSEISDGNASGPSAPGTAGNVRRGVFPAPTTGAIPQRPGTETSAGTAATANGNAAAGASAEAGSGTTAPRPSTSKKRWDGSGPSGAPSDASEAPAQ